MLTIPLSNWIIRLALNKFTNFSNVNRFPLHAGLVVIFFQLHTTSSICCKFDYLPFHLCIIPSCLLLIAPMFLLLHHLPLQLLRKLFKSQSGYSFCRITYLIILLCLFISNASSCFLYTDFKSDSFTRVSLGFIPQYQQGVSDSYYHLSVSYLISSYLSQFSCTSKKAGWVW